MSLALGCGLLILCVTAALFLPPQLSQALARGALAPAAGPWSLPAAIVVFAIFAFLGVPQLALIAAAVVALGPGWGAFDSWAGTFVSALIGFWLGRRLGAGALARVASGSRGAALVDALGRNGFTASFVVRLFPTVPFLAVNMAAGALPISAFDYAAGTAIGIVPKIALTALAGRSLLSLPAPHPAALTWLAIAATLWLALTLAAWLRLRRRTAPA